MLRPGGLLACERAIVRLAAARAAARVLDQERLADLAAVEIAARDLERPPFVCVNVCEARKGVLAELDEVASVDEQVCDAATGATEV